MVKGGGGKIWEFYPISVDFTSIVVINIYRQKERIRSSLIWDSTRPNQNCFERLIPLLVAIIFCEA
jgi:hypothetical protein